MKREIEQIKKKNGFIIDMDGVIYHGNKLLPGAKDFVRWLKEETKKFVFLTNSSERTPKELHEKLNRLGMKCTGQVLPIANRQLKRTGMIQLNPVVSRG